MKIEIKNSREQIIEQYYTLVNPLLGSKKLTKLEIKVISKMASVYLNYQHLGKDIANSLLFQRQTKKLVREAVAKDLNSAFVLNSLEVMLYNLRNKGLITFKEILYLPPLKDGKIEINFNLIVVNEE